MTKWSCNMPEEENFRQRRKIDDIPLDPPKSNDPDELFEELKQCILRYHPSTDLSQIEKAYHVAKDAHKDQKRKSIKYTQLKLPTITLEKI